MKQLILQTTCFSAGLLIFFGFISLVLAPPGMRLALFIGVSLGVLAQIVAAFAWAMRKLWVLSGRLATAITFGDGSKPVKVGL